MKKAMIGLLGVLVMVAGLVSTSFGWERGTHAYIAHLVKKGGGPNTVEAMYAATAPDVFNFFFTPPGVFLQGLPVSANPLRSHEAYGTRPRPVPRRRPPRASSATTTSGAPTGPPIPVH